MPVIRHRIFTITGGRTGTAWVVELVRANTDCPAVHESTKVDDIGVKSPDIRTMRHFNTYGMTPLIRSFWRNKFSILPDTPTYLESNHALAKAGLVEALAEQSKDRISILLLRRNWHDQVASYVDRGDFERIANVWLWYLDPRIPRRIIDPADLLELGTMGTAIWYAAEMEARQEYYRQLYADRFEFIDCTLEAMTTEAGAGMLLKRLGFTVSPVLPPRRNAKREKPKTRLRRKLFEALDTFRFDPVAEAQRFIEAGKSLHRPAED
ncbi:MAG: hypothetical protein AAF724_09530 [Pseudomonadota bacterium]